MEEENIMIRQIKGGISNIDVNPIDALEKLNKYEFIYDYNAIPAPIWNFAVPNMLKEYGSNANMIAPSGIWSGQYFPQPVRVNKEAQIGFFSKGNIVNVIRFDGNNAIIENVNYKEPDPNIKKTWFGELLGGVINKKELSIPKDYLRKVDDTLDATILTGINYGANVKPQPVYYMPPVKTIPDFILEENASFVLNQDYRYTKNTYCPPYARCVAPPQFTINSGTKITGRLIRRNNNYSYMTPAGFITPNTYFTFLEAKGVGVDGSINIPIDYLTRDVAINTNNNSGTVVPVKNDNENLLMIAGAFLLGYALFRKGKSNN